MLRMGIEALAPRPGTSKRPPGHNIFPYLLRNLAVTRANQVLAMDTSYLPKARGFVCLIAVVDVVSRKVLAHRVVITLEAVHAREVIEQAFCALQLLFQPQQSFAVYSVLVPVIGLGFEQALDVERANLHPLHSERPHMLVKAFISLPVGGEQ